MKSFRHRNAEVTEDDLETIGDMLKNQKIAPTRNMEKQKKRIRGKTMNLKLKESF